MSNRLYAKDTNKMEAPSYPGLGDDWQSQLRRAEIHRGEVLGELVVKAFRGIGAMFSNFGQAIARARTASELSALDDRMLADIGLTRGDIPAFVAGHIQSARQAIANSGHRAEVRKAA